MSLPSWTRSPSALCRTRTWQKVVDCMKDGVTESIAPLLVQFGSYRKSHLIEVVTCEQMAERYKKAGI